MIILPPTGMKHIGWVKAGTTEFFAKGTPLDSGAAGTITSYVAVYADDPDAVLVTFKIVNGTWNYPYGDDDGDRVVTLSEKDNHGKFQLKFGFIPKYMTPAEGAEAEGAWDDAALTALLKAYDDEGTYGTLTLTEDAIYTYTFPMKARALAVTVNGTYTYDGKEQKPDPVVTCGEKTLKAGEDYVVTYEDNINAGTAKVNVYGIGDYAGQVASGSFTIDQAQAVVSFADNMPEVTYSKDGAFFNPITVSDFVPANGVTYVSGNGAVAIVDATTGEVTIKGAGSTTITATVADDANYKGNFESYTLTVHMADAVLWFDNSVMTVPADIGGTVTNKLNGVPDGAQVEYSIGVSSVATVNPSTGLVTIRGAGEVTVTAKLKNFANYNDTSASYTLTIDSKALPYTVFAGCKTYDGNQHTVGVTTTAAGAAVTYSTDGINWSDDVPKFKNAGSYTVYFKIEAPGYDSVSDDFIFVIHPAELTSADPLDGKEYDGQAYVEQPTNVKTKTSTGVVPTGDYTVQYYNNVDAGTGVAVITPSSPNYTGMIVKTFTITQRSLNSHAMATSHDQYYTGNAVTPVVTVTDASLGVLTEGKDYTVSVPAGTNIEPGRVSVQITGTGNYTGTLNTGFNIVHNASTLNVFVDQSEQIYDGTEKKPAVLVTAGGKVLTKGTDYTLNYSDNTEVGTATVTATGKGSYLGLSGTATFPIVKADMTVAFADHNVNATYGDDPFGNIVTVDPAAALGWYRFELAYSSSNPAVATWNSAENKFEIHSAGVTTITVTAPETDNYNTASDSFTLTVAPKKIHSVDAIPNQVYTGSEIRPAVTVWDVDGNKLTARDYTVSYWQNTDIGQATVTVQGTGNYTGKKYAFFQIVAAENTVTFNANGGTFDSDAYGYTLSADGERLTFTGSVGAKAPIPANVPLRTGYVFAGWYDKPVGGMRVPSAGVPITADGKICYAQWEPIILTIVFQAPDGSVAHQQTLRPEDGFCAPALPTNTDESIYMGWEGGFLDLLVLDAGQWCPYFIAAAYADANHELTFKPVELKVAYYDVTFNYNDGGNTPSETVQVESGGVVAAKADPQRAGYTFEGWYRYIPPLDPDRDNLTVQWDFANDTVNCTVELVAQWAEAKLTAVFEYPDGTWEKIEIDPTDTASYPVPDLPAATDNAVYLAWETDDGAVIFGDVDYSMLLLFVDGSNTVTFKPATEARQLKYVAFDVNGGTLQTTLQPNAVGLPHTSVKAGLTVGDPGTPTRPGFIFKGWYMDPVSLGIQWNFASDPVQDNMTLIAQWEPVIIGIDPSVSNAKPGETVIFAANVSDSKADIVWSVEYSDGTKAKSELKGFGLGAALTIADDEADDVLVVKATVNGTDVFAFAVVNVGFQISIDPLQAEVRVGDSVNFEVKLLSDPNDEGVTWEVRNSKNEVVTTPSITATGKLTGTLDIPAGETERSFVVIATSVADPSLVAFATVTVKEPETCMVTFTEGNNGRFTDASEDGKVGIQENQAIGAANVPGITANSGYKFMGWTMNGDSNTIYTSAAVEKMTVTQDTAFTACYEKITNTTIVNGGGGGGGTTNYALSFQENGGTAIEPVSKPSGSTIDLSGYKPTRVGYTFMGWYADKGLTEKVTSVKLTKNMVIYAGWTLDAPLNTEDHIAYVMGYTDGTVRPNANITRAEAVTMLYRLLTAERRDEIFTTRNSFSDVDAGDWCNKAISSVVNGGYIDGYKDGTFKPDQAITRGEFVSMLVRFIGVDSSATASFSDVPRSSDLYAYIATATSAGWIEGYEDGTFRPEQPISRAETMAVVNRVLGRGVDEDSELLNYKKWPDNSNPDAWYYYEIIEATNDHVSDGGRPSENWTSMNTSYTYDVAKYENP